MDKQADKKTKRQSSLNMQKIIIGVVLVLIFFAAGARFGVYLSNDQSAPVVGEETAPGMLKVDIKGAVANPGLYDLLEGSRVADALAAAGELSNAETGLLNICLLYTSENLILLYQQIRWTSCFPRRRNGTMPSWNESKTFRLLSCTRLRITHLKSKMMTR